MPLGSSAKQALEICGRKAECNAGIKATSLETLRRMAGSQSSFANRARNSALIFWIGGINAETRSSMRCRPTDPPHTKERISPMKRTILSVSLFLAAAGSAIAGPSTDEAKLHFQAIGSGDTALLARGYADNAQLNWIGGPLDGTYTGPASIVGAWETFTKSQGPLKVSVGKIEESGNPKGATVTANVQFEGKQPIKVRYVLTYREGKLVNETWQIDPKLALSGY